jgi:hypothetical protein
MKMEKLPPARLSRELRLGEGEDLRRRRAVLALSFASAAIGGIVSAYQMGLIRRLPDILPGSVFDAEKVDASDYAYEKYQMPDGPQMLVTYGITAALVAAGGEKRAEQAPLLPFAAAGKALYDFILCLVLARREWAENRKLCSWCQVATALSGATVALTLPEAIKAARNLRPASAAA